MSRAVQVAVVVGNPKPASRTLAAATYLAGELAGREPDLVVDLAELSGELLDWGSERVARLVEEVSAADLVVVASPTYKASYTGLLKLFLDRFGAGQLSGVGVPLMLGAGPGHELAVEYTLRPLLSLLGAAVPTTGLYVTDSRHDDPSAYADWLQRARPLVGALLHHTQGAPA
ncbi:NAD(P)H-dependent oxidoreductase [Nocardioides dubius]|uniref:NAD(P)H-dependent oxidoreductase n=1 Tax=Nocardioides dubius TaxID=317019 RepID=A0ABP4EQ10_9ACTN